MNRRVIEALVELEFRGMRIRIWMRATTGYEPRKSQPECSLVLDKLEALWKQGKTTPGEIAEAYANFLVVNAVQAGWIGSTESIVVYNDWP